MNNPYVMNTNCSKWWVDGVGGRGGWTGWVDGVVGWGRWTGWVDGWVDGVGGQGGWAVHPCV